MKKLLHIIASPRGTASNTLEVSNVFLETYRQKYPDAEIREVNVWEKKLPEFDGDGSAAKLSFFGYDAMNAQQRTLYDELMKTFEEFDWADDYLISSPMWNFGVPYKLKHYIDILTMPKTYFDMNLKDGSYLPCLKPGKRATTVHSAAVYYPGVNDRYGVDHLSNSLSDWLKLGGITDVQSVWYHYNRFMSQEKAEHNFEVASSFAREAAKR